METELEANYLCSTASRTLIFFFIFTMKEFKITKHGLSWNHTSAREIWYVTPNDKPVELYLYFLLQHYGARYNLVLARNPDTISSLHKGRDWRINSAAL